MPAYTVTDTQQISSMTPGGATITMYRVWLQTARGSRGRVDVPEDKWNREQVAEILSAEAEKLDLALDLASG
jgi:hypothetical protein